MKIFNHTFYFNHLSKTQTAITVSEKKDIPLLSHFPLVSEWIEASGRRVRYYSHIPFGSPEPLEEWGFEVESVIMFLWRNKERKIFYQKEKAYTSERFEFWLYHTFFPLVLELKAEYQVLHAASVEVGGKAILFSAPSYGGKSTLTHCFLSKGHTLLGDDTVAIEKREEGYRVIASYPYYRPYRQNEVLGEKVVNFASSPLPLGKVYVLAFVEAEAEVAIDRILGVEKFKILYESRFVEFDFFKNKRFDDFSKMSREIDIYKVSVPFDQKRLEEVYEAIVSHSNI